MWTNPLVIDVETTTFQKGNPFSRQNKLCTVGQYDGTTYTDYDIEYSNTPYGKQLEDIKKAVEDCDLLIGFNLKFDIHWLRRYIDVLTIHDVWDSQLAEFILCNQSIPYPSLNWALERYSLPAKLDRVSSEFWSRGIGTCEIPWDILADYQKQDVIQTYELYKKQKEQFEQGDPRIYEMFKLQCKDLLVLEEAEFHGMLLNVEKANEYRQLYSERILSIRTELHTIVGDERINWGSTDHISVLLYGGKLSFKIREQYSRQLKSGEFKVRERWGTEEVEFPRLVRPMDRSESKVTASLSDEELNRLNAEKLSAGLRPIQRLYSVDEASLRGLRGNSKVKRIVGLLLELAELEKLVGTYYEGLPKLIEEMDWNEGELHGQFNQCVVITSRLSSSRPNLQNLAGATKELYVSRF